MRRTSRGGWLSRLAAKRPKQSWVWRPESSNRKTENQAKARRLRHANAGLSTGPNMPDTAPHAAEHFTSGGVKGRRGLLSGSSRHDI